MIMFEKINEQMTELKEKGRQKEKGEKRLVQLKEERNFLEDACIGSRNRLAREEKDVERLTGMSLSNFLFSLVGKKEEKLDEEQQEVLAARLKYEEADRAVQDIDEQIAKLEQQLQEISGWKYDYDLIFQAKEKQILLENKELMNLTERQAELKVEVRELDEAIHAGQSVLDSLDQAEESLESARNWGTYDMLGGGMLSTHIKHNKLDEAMDYIYEAQIRLRRFERELNDVGGIMRDVNLDIDGVLKFSDYFFDGLIADWMVQGRIKEALDQLHFKIGEVNQMVVNLQSAKRKTEAELSTIQARYVQVVETYP